MPQGQIRKAISGFYYVYDGQNLLPCKGRGVFRNRGISPLVGDYVDYEKDGENEGVITIIHERKNELVRPPVSNIDLALLVFSAKEPEFSPHLLDRFLVVIESHQIEPIICITKNDLMTDRDESYKEKIAYYESIGYTVISTSREDNGIIDKLGPYLSGKISVLAGQSGVGKSSLLNMLVPDLNLKTGEISEALGRGKHTTRHVELVEVAGGLIADTPGFSSLDFDHIDKEELSSNFIEFDRLSQACKFRGCLHVKEPKCAVKTAVENGEVAKSRYDNYLQFLQEIMDRKPRYE